MSMFKKLMGEAHQRSLWQIVGIYLAASWVVLQVVGQIADSLVLPAWVEPLAIILLLVGFPIVLATAFIQGGLGRRAGPGDGLCRADGQPTAAYLEKPPQGKAAGLGAEAHAGKARSLS